FGSVARSPGGWLVLGAGGGAVIYGVAWCIAFLWRPGGFWGFWRGVHRGGSGPGGVAGVFLGWFRWPRRGDHVVWGGCLARLAWFPGIQGLDRRSVGEEHIGGHRYRLGDVRRAPRRYTLCGTGELRSGRGQRTRMAGTVLRMDLRRDARVDRVVRNCPVWP